MGFSSEKLHVITRIEFFILFFSVPIHFYNHLQINSYFQDISYYLSTNIAIWHFENSAKSYLLFSDFLVVLFLAALVCPIISLLFSSIYFTKKKNDESPIIKKLFSRHIYAGILGFSSPIIVLLVLISIIVFVPYVKSYDYNKVLISAVSNSICPLNFIEELLKKGADVNTTDYKGKTPLMYSTRRIDIVKLLLTRGADVNAVSNEGKTALMGAWDLDIIRLLLEYGANIDAKDNKGKTHFTNAVSYGEHYNNVSKFLLDKGADINSKDEEDRTILVQLSHFPRNIDQMRFLIEKGADIDLKDKYGVTALMLASSAKNIGRVGYPRDKENTLNQVEVVNLLIENGANVNLRDNQGRTALILACYDKPKNDFSQQLEVVKILIENGAELDIVDDKGNTALSIASENPDASIEELLLEQ